MRISAHWAARALPFLETGAMEDMLTEDGKQSRRFVHAFKADRTRG